MEMSKTDECVTLFENNPPPARKFLQTPVFRIIRVSGGIFYFFILTEFKKMPACNWSLVSPEKKYTLMENIVGAGVWPSLFFFQFFFEFPPTAYETKGE